MRTQTYFDMLAFVPKNDEDATLVCDEHLTMCVNGEEACTPDASVPDYIAWWSDGEDSRYEDN